MTPGGNFHGRKKRGWKMNNLEEWTEARRVVREAWQKWGPHFETLKSGNGEKMLAFFLLKDTTAEWQLYNTAPPESDFAEYMQDTKEELFERVGFDPSSWQTLTDEAAGEMTGELSELIKDYEKKERVNISGLAFNYLLYSEWLLLPEDVLEKRYEKEVNSYEDTGEE